MSDWNPTLVTPDGEEIEPSDSLAGSHDRPGTESEGTASRVNAKTLRRKQLEDTTPEIGDGEDDDTFACPVCGRERDAREGQADCMRSHARRLADKLELQAREGYDVLEDGRVVATDGGQCVDAIARRSGSRLEVDDPEHCKWCGAELPEMLVHGPIAGEGTEHPPVELCGGCEGNRLKHKTSAIYAAKENWGVTISLEAIDDPPEDWDLSTELWYQWSAEVQAQRIAEGVE